MPYLLIRGLCEIPKKSDNIHFFKHDRVPISGKKKGAFSMDLDVGEIKTLCKKLKCTVNDYVCATLGTSLYEYFENH